MHATDMLFIGGTGRSGTTILKKALSENSAFTTFPAEPRFFVDYGGHSELFQVLCFDWDPYRASSAIMTFRSFFLSTFTTNPFFRAFRIGCQKLKIAPFKYRQVEIASAQSAKLILAVDDFISNLGYTATESIWYGSPSFSRKQNFYSGAKVDKCAFQSASAKYVADVAVALNSESKASYLVDDTPYTIMLYDTLSLILPAAKFVHIVRNPLDVYCSYRKQAWMRNRGAENTLVDIYEKLIEIDSNANGSNYLVIKLEDLVVFPDDTADKLSQFLGQKLQLPAGLVRFDQSSFERHLDELTQDEIYRLTTVFKRSIIHFSY